VASAAGNQFDVVLAFSTKYRPVHPLLEDWAPWQRLKEKYFGYHRDLSPEEIAQRLGGRIAFSRSSDGQWVAVIAIEREEQANYGVPADQAIIR
jgi:hypothetical protein